VEGCARWWDYSLLSETRRVTFCYHRPELLRDWWDFGYLPLDRE
jgi:hypothetical protein